MYPGIDPSIVNLEVDGDRIVHNPNRPGHGQLHNANPQIVRFEITQQSSSRWIHGFGLIDLYNMQPSKITSKHGHYVVVVTTTADDVINMTINGEYIGHGQLTEDEQHRMVVVPGRFMYFQFDFVRFGTESEAERIEFRVSRAFSTGSPGGYY